MLMTLEMGGGLIGVLKMSTFELVISYRLSVIWGCFRLEYVKDG